MSKLLVEFEDHELLEDDIRRILAVEKKFLNSLGDSPSNVTQQLYTIFQLMDRLFSADRDPSDITYRLFNLDVDKLVSRCYGVCSLLCFRGWGGG